MNSQQIKGLNLSLEAIKLIRENITESLLEMCLLQHFVKIGREDYIKGADLSMAKVTTNLVRINYKTAGNYFQAKELLSHLYKNSINSLTTTTKPSLVGDGS